MEWRRKGGKEHAALLSYLFSLTTAQARIHTTINSVFLSCTWLID